MQQICTGRQFQVDDVETEKGSDELLIVMSVCL